MSSDFYYFVSSLPSLNYGAPLPWSREDFLRSCANSLDAADESLVKSVSLEPGSQPVGSSSVEFLHQWYAWETDMRNTIADYRARTLKQAPGRWNRQASQVNMLDRKHLEDILNSTRAREREEAIDRFRWQKIEELSTGHNFDLTSVLAYSLKIQLAEKFLAMNAEKGSQIFQTISEKLQAQANQVQTCAE